jgi:KDO2-lipid IV(A) lauroyltransferase
LPDQDFGRRKSVFAPFFGIMAATSPLLSKYAKMTQAVVIPAYAVRRKNIPGFDVFVEQPIDIPSHSEQHPAHLIEDATRMNQMIEHMILQDISSYFWPMRRFRTRPNPQDKIYS